MTMKLAKKTAPSRKRNDKGFSLIELIIVITIMAILTALLAPQLLRYVEQSRVAKDAATMDELARLFQLALVADLVDPGGNLFVSSDGTVYNMSGHLANEMSLLLGKPNAPRPGSAYFQIIGAIPPLTSKLFTSVPGRSGQPIGTHVFFFTRITSNNVAVDWTIRYVNNPLA